MDSIFPELVAFWELIWVFLINISCFQCEQTVQSHCETTQQKSWWGQFVSQHQICLHGQYQIKSFLFCCATSCCLRRFSTVVLFRISTHVPSSDTTNVQPVTDPGFLRRETSTPEGGEHPLFGQFPWNYMKMKILGQERSPYSKSASNNSKKVSR